MTAFTTAQRKELKADIKEAILTDAFEQFKIDVKLRGVIWNFREGNIMFGKLRTGIIRKGEPIPTSITKKNIPPYRCMTKKERRTL